MGAPGGNAPGPPGPTQPRKDGQPTSVTSTAVRYRSLLRPDRGVATSDPASNSGPDYSFDEAARILRCGCVSVSAPLPYSSAASCSVGQGLQVVDQLAGLGDAQFVGVLHAAALPQGLHQIQPLAVDDGVDCQDL